MQSSLKLSTRSISGRSGNDTVREVVITISLVLSHGLWPSWSLFVAVVACGRGGLWPSLSNPLLMV